VLRAPHRARYLLADHSQLLLAGLPGAWAQRPCECCGAEGGRSPEQGIVLNVHNFELQSLQGWGRQTPTPPSPRPRSSWLCWGWSPGSFSARSEAVQGLMQQQQQQHQPPPQLLRRRRGSSRCTGVWQLVWACLRRTLPGACFSLPAHNPCPGAFLPNLVCRQQVRRAGGSGGQRTACAQGG